MKTLEKINNALKQKSILFILVFGIGTILIQAQSGSGFGIKGGLNYNGNGDYFESITANAENPDRNIGYHVGIFGKIGNSIYAKPELVYTSTKSSYSSDEFSLKKIDIPVLVGVKILGPLSVFGGPSFQYILNSKFEGVSIDDIDSKSSMGINFGIGLNLDKVGIDLRYERGLSDNEASFLNNNNIDTSRIETRPSQLIVSLSILL